MSFPELPPSLMQENTVEWNLAGATLAASGQTDAGAIPTSRLDGGGLWVAKLNDMQLYDDDRVRAFRALRTLAKNGSATLIVPRHEVLQPWPTIDGVVVKSYGSIPFSDGSLFSDGSGFHQDVIDIVSVGATALRATTMTIQVNQAGEIRGSEPFSIEHANRSHHLYEISTVVENDDGTFDITFEPPLREEVADGTQLNFDQPKCCMRLLTMDAMNYKLGTFPYIPPSAAFIECNVSSAEG